MIRLIAMECSLRNLRNQRFEDAAQCALSALIAAHLPGSGHSPVLLLSFWLFGAALIGVTLRTQCRLQEQRRQTVSLTANARSAPVSRHSTSSTLADLAHKIRKSIVPGVLTHPQERLLKSATEYRTAFHAATDSVVRFVALSVWTVLVAVLDHPTQVILLYAPPLAAEVVMLIRRVSTAHHWRAIAVENAKEFNLDGEIKSVWDGDYVVDAAMAHFRATP